VNELRKRLDDLARSETKHVALTDPSFAGPARRSPARLQIALAVGVVVAIAAMLFAWQGGDSTTSVAVGEGDGQDAATAAAARQPGDESDTVDESVAGAMPPACDLETLFPILRAGLPTFDYEPAGSFAALADQAQVVVRGSVTEVRRAEVNGRQYVELVLDDATDLVTGEARPDVDVIAYGAEWIDSSQPDPLLDPITVDGLTAIAFVSPWSGVRGGWAPGVEGLYVGCGFDSPHPAVIENAAGPDDPAEPTAGELRSVLGVRAGAQSAGDAAGESTDGEAEATPEDAIASAEDDVMEDASEEATSEDALVAEEEARQEAIREAALQNATDAAEAAARDAAEDAARVEQERIESLGLPAPDALAEARALWNATGITDYWLYYADLGAGGSIAGSRVDVLQGEVVAVKDRGGPELSEQVLTVEDMFDAIEAADNVREARFDPTLGFPIEYSLDPDDTVPGDEYRVSQIELVTAAEAASLNASIDAWMPGDPIEIPSEAQEFVDMTGDDVVRLHELISVPELTAWVYRTDDLVCYLVDERRATDEGRTGGGCTGSPNFVTKPLSNAHVRLAGDAYILAVPPLGHFGAGWTVSMSPPEIGRLTVNDHAALLLVDEEDVLEPGPFRITLDIECECGNESFTLPFG